MAAKVGDTVRFLNDVGGGVVVKIKDNMAYVADADGFETPIMLRECVVVEQARPAERKAPDTVIMPSASPVQPQSDEPEPIEETVGGDKLNVVLAFEAHDLKRLSQSGFDAYLVNDSNYFLYFTFLTRKDEDNAKWAIRYAGVVEPNFQLLVSELNIEDLSDIDRVAVQFIAFKRDKKFELKAPVAYESRLDTTKFAKLHCFHENVYFDNPVIALDIVKDDIAQKGTLYIESIAAEKIFAKDTKIKDVKSKPVSRKARKNNDPIVIDLHINELIDTTAGMSNADILNYQIDKFREVMDANIKFGGRKIIFIHGKGEGVLRQALLKEMNYRYRSCAVQDASFREYGYGATQVTIYPPSKSRDDR